MLSSWRLAFLCQNEQGNWHSKQLRTLYRYRVICQQTDCKDKTNRNGSCAQSMESNCQWWPLSQVKSQARNLGAIPLDRLIPRQVYAPLGNSLLALLWDSLSVAIKAIVHQWSVDKDCGFVADNPCHFLWQFCNHRSSQHLSQFMLLSPSCAQ